jgi:hypothetical protein
MVMAAAVVVAVAATKVTFFFALGSRRPVATARLRGPMCSGDPLNLIRVMPAKGTAMTLRKAIPVRRDGFFCYKQATKAVQ